MPSPNTEDDNAHENNKTKSDAIDRRSSNVSMEVAIDRRSSNVSMQVFASNMWENVVSGHAKDESCPKQKPFEDLIITNEDIRTKQPKESTLLSHVELKKKPPLLPRARSVFGFKTLKRKEEQGVDSKRYYDARAEMKQRRACSAPNIGLERNRTDINFEDESDCTDFDEFKLEAFNRSSSLFDGGDFEEDKGFVTLVNREEENEENGLLGKFGKWMQRNLEAENCRK
eukprot:CAMPEP_0172480786 /NCGR_PEP_ID=MMETSP1066-20121228/6230_1 /TAXON_ID=671091 /ORGANISM="Coscinodiscus wailesii, Strain CCMP2513" /LENGTH=227 /DNA_ID=CAMNT_0013242455 /DNA_START=72 /DNA_END=755 /DNA_ORIENTATION=-